MAKISPSILTADYLALDEKLKAFESAGVDMVHIDVMDGEFVPNIALGVDFIKQLKQNCKIPLDIHLMIENPDKKLDFIPFSNSDIESEKNCSPRSFRI